MSPARAKGKKKKGAARAGSGRRAWLLLPVGLALAVAVLWSLATLRDGDPSEAARAPATTARTEPPAAPVAAEPRDHIGADSRNALRQILREADGEGSE